MQNPDHFQEVLDILKALEARIQSMGTDVDPRPATLVSLRHTAEAIERLRDHSTGEMLRQLRDIHRIDLLATAPCPACHAPDFPVACTLCGGIGEVSNAVRYAYLSDISGTTDNPGRLLGVCSEAADPDIISLESRRR